MLLHKRWPGLVPLGVPVPSLTRLNAFEHQHVPPCYLRASRSLFFDAAAHCLALVCYCWYDFITPASLIALLAVNMEVDPDPCDVHHVLPPLSSLFHYSLINLTKILFIVYISPRLVGFTE